MRCALLIHTKVCPLIHTRSVQPQEKKPAAKKQKASPARKQKAVPAKAEAKEKASNKSEDTWVPEDKELWDTIVSICTKADLSTLTLRMVRLLLLTAIRCLEMKYEVYPPIYIALAFSFCSASLI